MARRPEARGHRAGSHHRPEHRPRVHAAKPRTRSTGGSTASSSTAATRCPDACGSRPGRCATTAMFWVQVDGLEKHWERANVEADLIGERRRDRGPTENVTALTLRCPPAAARWTRHEAAAGDDRRQPSRRRPGAVRPLVDGPLPQGRRQVGARSLRPTTARCASGTACRGRSTTPSWTVS